MPPPTTCRHVPPPALSPDAYALDSKCGTGVILYIDRQAHELVAVPSLCHRWDCPVCGPARMRKAKALAIAGNPERLITLTTRPKPDWGTEASVRWFRRRWQRLLAWLRKEFSRFEYMAFIELHKSGWPHIHILTRGCYVPERMLSAKWLELTGSFKVHIQAVRNGWKGVQEATKYYLKTARQLHEATPHLPVYTKSKGWLPPDWEDTKDERELLTPYTYVRTSWAGFRDHIEALGGSLEQRPGSPGRFNVQFRAPPDLEHQDLIFDIGSFAEKALVSAVAAFFSSAPDRPFDIDEAKAQIDYYTSPPEDMPPSRYPQYTLHHHM
ncbi:hypothetical protein ES703_27573 [subsurface metagenome]